MTSADKLIELLHLRPHDREGGWFTETYRCSDTLDAGVLPARYGSARAVCTAIYYLIRPHECSTLHRLQSDEIFHFYAGSPVTMLQLGPAGGRVVTIGNDLAAGQQPQVVVERGIWQGSCLAAGGDYALLGCTVSPGFDYADYESGDRTELTARYPEFADLIRRLTKTRE